MLLTDRAKLGKKAKRESEEVPFMGSLYHRSSNGGEIMKRSKWIIVSVLLVVNVDADVVTIDENYNQGANVAEYLAREVVPYNGTAVGPQDSGNADFEIGKAVGVSSSGNLQRAMFFFDLDGYSSSQITNAVLKVRLNAKTDVTNPLDIYSAATDSLGAGTALYARQTYGDASFTDSGLGLGTGAAVMIQQYDVTSIVQLAAENGEISKCFDISKYCTWFWCFNFCWS